jgi:hypothetical protein
MNQLLRARVQMLKGRPAYAGQMMKMPPAFFGRRRFFGRRKKRK